MVAVINLDSVSGKAKAVSDAGRKTNVARYTAPEGKRLADLMALVNEQYRIGLEEYSYWKEIPNDDDGSFIKAGFPCAIACLGSFPYADPNYHLESDRPEAVDLENLRRAAQAALATVIRLDQE
ncbi:MAG TPA: M28 family peptidase [Armatimonadota bacterium]|nr:M28 family peptidase [Armatimonadota bacterium]